MPVLGSTAATPFASWFNVKDYGAVGDNSHDDTTAIQAAINACKAAVNAASGSFGGNTIYFPPGYYKTTGRLDFTAMPEVRILGGAGRGRWGRLAADANPPTVIVYAAGGSTTAVDLADCTGCIWDGVCIRVYGGTYTGIVMNWDAATTPHDVFGNRVQNCSLESLSGCTALMTLDGNIEFSADNVTFGQTADSANAVQIRGFNPAGAASWSNANSFRSCSFISTRKYSFLNPGPQTTFIDCTFEPTSGNTAAPICVTGTGGGGADAFAFIGCGFWDVTAGSAPWIQSVTVATHAWAFTGCRFDCPPTGPTIDLAAHSGLTLNGCYFNSPGGGTPNIFTPAVNITNGSMLGCYVKSPVVDNHASVFV